jgi:nucleotide-binding universal stress UspA family protein
VSGPEHGAVDQGGRFGDPVEVVLAEAEEFDADTSLVTTAGRHAVKRALLGSVAEAIVCRARAGVLLYRARQDG